MQQFGAFKRIGTIFTEKHPSNSSIFLNLAAILKKVAIFERYQMGLYHISTGTSEANFVQNVVLLSEFERFLLKNILRIAAFS